MPQAASYEQRTGSRETMLNKVCNFRQVLDGPKASAKSTSLEVIIVPMDGHANQWVASQTVDL